jgi:hypothetical protein
MNNSTKKILLIFCLSIIGLHAFAQEPTSHPTGFAAVTQSGGTSITLNWTGSIGANLPSDYIILVRVVPSGTFTAIADNSTIANDNDLTDNAGAQNVTHAVGANTYTWTGLPLNTDFEFTIYPYKTGGATNPDYKTSPAAPIATASTKVPTVTSPTATGVNEIDATLGGTVTSNGGNALTERGTVWKTSAGVTIADNKQSEGGTTVSAFTHARTGLPSGTRIFYAAYATNVAGTALSSESSFYTYSTLPGGQPASVTATAVSSSQINLTFSAFNTLTNTNGYVILRRVGSGPSTASVQDGVAPTSLALGASTYVTTITNSGTTTFNDTGLGAGTDYYYSVIPFNWNTTNPETYNYRTSGGFTTDNDVTFSGTSDITFTGGTTASISYKNYQSGSIADNQSNSLTLADFTIRDGGGSADPDTKTTIVNSITVQIANFANVRSIALFNDDTDTEIPGTEQTVSGTNVTFTPTTPITVADDGTFNINVRATFQQTVTDKQTIHITITGVSAGAAGSGFASANAGGASTTTAGTTNQINVTASKLVFQANPPTTPISTNFSLTVRALDSNPYNNLDLDYTGQIDLTGSGGSGVLSSGAQPLNPSLVAGQYTWTQLQFNLAGTYTLDAFDDLHGDVLNDATGTVVISSAGVNITKPATLNLCYGGSFQTLGNIVITEADPGDFANNGTSSFSLALPTGFIFDQTVTTAPVVGGGSDISAPTTLSYPGENVVQFSYNISGTSNINTITISGLKIRYPGSTAPASTSITRIGGTATIAGDPVGTQHGTVTAALGTPPPGLGFTVSGDALVNPNETRFNQSSNAIQLDGSPATPGVGVFTGSGVTFTGGKYKFNPSSLSPGNYTITYTYTDASAQQCSFTFSKSFEVYVTNISGLQTKYCDNDAQSPALSVSPVYITTRYGAGYTFQKFVYYNYASFTPVDLTTPAANVFDPKLYESVYIATQTYTGIYGIYIGFTVSNGLFTSTEWQFVTIKKAQKPNFSMPKTFFCADEPPVVLTGDPANSNSTGTDFFTASAGKQTSISSGGTPTVWTFNPASVSGVTTATPVNFNITYTYQDPATLCSTTSDPQVITVSARPSIVPAANISPGTTIELCQGTTVSSFTASAIPGTTYSWYSNNPPTNQVGIGNSFLPPVSNLIAGTSNFYVTRTINGCESTQAPLSLAVTVNASPGAPVSDFSREYCVNQAIPNSDLVVTGSNVKWYNAADVLIYSGSNPSAANLGINNTVAATYSFTATQTVNSCEGARTKISITVKPLPGLDIIASIPDVNRICVTGGFVTFEARDQGLTAPNGSWSGSGGIGSALVPNPGAGTVQLNPSLLSPGGYNLHLVYQNPSTTCSNTQDLAITILPTINPSISIGTACNGFPVSITNNSTMVPGSSTSTIASTGWTFGDGTSLVAGDGSVPAGTNLGKTTGTYFSPNHIFGGLGNFLIQYTMTTSDGCVVTPAPIPVTINPNPNSTFTWEKVCYDAVTGSNTSFFANTSNIADANIQSYTWNFTKANQLTIGTSGVGKNPTVNYTSVGVDSVQLIVTTIANCKDTVQKPVFIVPAYPAITETNSYSQDFDAGTDGWIAGGTKSSWAYGKPSGAVINKDASAGGAGNAWDTNLTGNSNSNEQSWVLSQCYDFTQAQKPIISLDIWSDTPSGNDGAVLQYNENGNIENDANWTVIGQIGQGANWYDESGISSSPGNQSANDLGWTGIYGGWRRAIFKLDNLIGKPNVVFRVAFASNIPRREGFAFDNVFIGERTRTVLVESFTNTSAAANTKLHNDAFSAFSSNSTEVAKIQFHTAFPGEDPLNKANVEINNSRTAFYGITNTAMFSLDGSVVNNVTGLTQLYNDRVLTPSAVRINTTLVKDGELVRIQTSITNATNQTIPTAGINLFTVIVEKSITEASMLGSNGDTELSFVAKEMLPTAAGIKLTEDIAPLSTIALPEVVWNNRNLITSGNGAIVVFLQSIEGGNKNVYQAKILDATVEPDLVTGIEHGYAAEINVYPNPTQGLLNIQLPQPASQALPVSLLDGFGREVYTSQFKNGENTKVISTSEFAGGIYILQLKSAKGEVVRKKIIVANKQ